MLASAIGQYWIQHATVYVIPDLHPANSDNY